MRDTGQGVKDNGQGVRTTRAEGTEYEIRDIGKG